MGKVFTTNPKRFITQYVGGWLFLLFPLSAPAGIVVSVIGIGNFSVWIVDKIRKEKSRKGVFSLLLIIFIFISLFWIHAYLTNPFLI